MTANIVPDPVMYEVCKAAKTHRFKKYTSAEIDELRKAGRWSGNNQQDNFQCSVCGLISPVYFEGKVLREGPPSFFDLLNINDPPFVAEVRVLATDSEIWGMDAYYRGLIQSVSDEDEWFRHRTWKPEFGKFPRSYTWQGFSFVRWKKDLAPILVQRLHKIYNKTGPQFIPETLIIGDVPPPDYC